MSTITYEVGTTTRTGTARTGVPAAAPVRTGLVTQPGLFSRLLARFMAARQKQAMHELQRHGLRLPRELEEAGLKISARNEDSLPFVR
jgi:hypothetical protein